MHVICLFELLVILLANVSSLIRWYEIKELENLETTFEGAIVNYVILK
jgi:hypothetical protein